MPVTGVATASTCSGVGTMSCASCPWRCAATTSSSSVPRADQPQSHKICLIIEHHRRDRRLRSGCHADASVARGGYCRSRPPARRRATGWSEQSVAVSELCWFGEHHVPVLRQPLVLHPEQVVERRRLFA